MSEGSSQVEVVMSALKQQGFAARDTDHYNRVYEIVWRILRGHKVDTRATPGIFLQRTAEEHAFADRSNVYSEKDYVHGFEDGVRWREQKLQS